MKIVDAALTKIGLGPCELCNRGHRPMWRGLERWHSDGREGITTYYKCGLEKDDEAQQGQPRSA